MLNYEISEEAVNKQTEDAETISILSCTSVEKLERRLSMKQHKFGGILDNSMLLLDALEPDIHHWYVYNLFPLRFFLHTGIISNRLIFDIGLVDQKSIAEDIKYRIIVGGQSGTENFITLAQRKVSTNMRYFPDLYGSNTIDYNATTEVLNSTEMCWHIHISIPNYIFQDRKISMTTITCLKCSVAMSAPIYKCADGHVICQDCAEEKDGVGWCYACPQVKMRFPNALKEKQHLQQIHRHNKRRVCLSRCLKMENISRWVAPLPCRWLSCNFETEDIRAHEKTCKYRMYSCSWWCNYTGTLEDLKAHMQKKHQDKLLFSAGEACINGKDDSKKFIIISNRDLFTVSMSTTTFGKEFYVCYKTPLISLQSEYTCTITLLNFDDVTNDSKVFEVPFYKKFDVTQEYLHIFNDQTLYICVKITNKQKQ